MKYRTRIQYTEADKSLMWERWRQGESLHAIARLFDRNHSVVGGILSRTGGIQSRRRCRSSLALALAEREEISRGVMARLSVRAIARTIGRPPCTVSRELRRNGGRRAYRASAADQAAWQRACQPERERRNREERHERRRCLGRGAEAQVVHRHANVVPRIEAADDDLRKRLEEPVVRHPNEKQLHRG
jgi:Helix-turn-helix domain